MGVLTCARKQCDEIMCRTYVDDVGYICTDCQDDFKLYIGDMYKDQAEVLYTLKYFMSTPKSIRSIGEFRAPFTIQEFFNKYNTN